MYCDVSKCEWSYSEDTKQYIFEVESDRFLRGMVRLIVGTCILVAKGDMLLTEVEYAMENQVRMPKNFSAPAQGLFLNKVEYDYDKTFK